MRVGLVLLLALIAVPGVRSNEGDPITPREAIERVNQTVTVEMQVKATKNRLQKRGEIYLDSETDFRDPKNLGIVVTKDGSASFKQAGIEDPAVHFKDKSIQVTGTVILKDDRPRIEVNDAKQIRLVDRK